MYTWISKTSDTDDTLVLHGETIIYGELLPPTLKYGFCLEMDDSPTGANKKWDCQAIDVQLEAADAKDDAGNTKKS